MESSGAIASPLIDEKNFYLRQNIAFFLKIVLFFQHFGYKMDIWIIFGNLNFFFFEYGSLEDTPCAIAHTSNDYNNFSNFFFFK